MNTNFIAQAQPVLVNWNIHSVISITFHTTQSNVHTDIRYYSWMDQVPSYSLSSSLDVNTQRLRKKLYNPATENKTTLNAAKRDLLYRRYNTNSDKVMQWFQTFGIE